MLMKFIMNSLIHTNSPSNFNIPKVIFTDRFMRIVARLCLMFFRYNIEKNVIKCIQPEKCDFL